MTRTTTTPQRTCIGCRNTRPQAALVRVVVGPNGSVIASPTAPGRGAWLCSLDGSCLELAQKRRGFDRALRRSLGDGALKELMTAVSDES